MDGTVIIGTELDTKSFEEQIKQTEDKLNRLEKSYEKASKSSGRFKQNEQAMANLRKEIEKTSNKLIDLRKRQSQIENTNFSKIQSSLNGVGNSIGNATKKVVRWGLAFLGIRSIIGLVTQSISTLSQYDDQLATNIEYIRYALANTLAPVIQWIINLVIKLLSYINYIAQAWFGVNLFANSSVKAFKDAKDNLGGAAKSAKEIKKQLAGFDEMNVLQDSSSGGDTGGGAGGAMPSFDLSGMQGEVPEWLKWIADHKDEILAVIAGIAAGLLAWKMGLDALKALGLGIAIAGIVLAIEGILAYLKDPSWNNFGKIVTGIGLAVAGVAIMFGAWPVALAGAIVAVIGIIISNWEKIKSFVQGIIDWLTNQSDFVRNTFGDTIGDIYDFFVREIQRGLDWLDLIFTSLKGILDGIIKFVKGVFTGNWKMAWEGVKQIFSNIWNAISGTVKLVLSSIVDKLIVIASTVGNVIGSAFKAVVNGILGAIENILNKPIRAVNNLIGVINKIPGINLGKLPTFSLPRLAKGGIINMPGRGVPIGSAIGGERGQEGVIPLTDSQQMALLGEAIGKYININATIPVYVGNRQIKRELRKIEAEDSFAFNR